MAYFLIVNISLAILHEHTDASLYSGSCGTSKILLAVLLIKTVVILYFSGKTVKVA